MDTKLMDRDTEYAPAELHGMPHRHTCARCQASFGCDWVCSTQHEPHYLLCGVCAYTAACAALETGPNATGMFVVGQL